MIQHERDGPMVASPLEDLISLYHSDVPLVRNQRIAGSFPPLTSILFEIHFRPAPGPSDSEHADCNPSTGRNMSLASGWLVRSEAAVMAEEPIQECRLV